MWREIIQQVRQKCYWVWIYGSLRHEDDWRKGGQACAGADKITLGNLDTLQKLDEIWI